MTNTELQYEVEFLGENEHKCEVDGDITKRIWGMVHEPDGPTLAAYWMQWTCGKVTELGASLDLVIGGRGDGTTANDRSHVALFHSQNEDGKPELMIVDATSRKDNYKNLAEFALAREDVIGTPMAQRIFSLVDAIYLSDDRILR